MPSPYSSRGSIDDALALARNLGIRVSQIPIGERFRGFQGAVRRDLRRPARRHDRGKHAIASARHDPDGALEQVRPPPSHAPATRANSPSVIARSTATWRAGSLSSAMCRKRSFIELARWINREREIIPASTIEKPPSAELKPDQRDQDTLPPYEILDEILQLYVEENLSAREIVARGFEEKTVRWVQRRVDLNEYKRAQAAPGIKVTSRAFGRRPADADRAAISRPRAAGWRRLFCDEIAVAPNESRDLPWQKPAASPSPALSRRCLLRSDSPSETQALALVLPANRRKHAADYSCAIVV